MENNNDKLMEIAAVVFKGKVEWFDPQKGFGFIARDDKNKDIFVHYTDITMPGYKLLMANDVVSFEEETRFGKLVAAKATLIERK